jgi:hypothetical protein
MGATEEREEMPELEVKGAISRDRWLIGLVAIGLVTAAGWGIGGVRSDAAEAMRKASALELRMAVAEAQRTSTADEYNRRFAEMSGQLSDMNRKLDWLVRRAGNGGGKDGQ